MNSSVFASSAGAAEAVAPVITTQPGDLTVDAGTDAVIIAAATGDPEPSVQWQSRTGSGAWSAVTGATSPTLTVPAVMDMSGTQYRAVFTNTAGSVTTYIATLTVVEPVLGDFAITVTDGEATITGFKDGVTGITDVVIPATVNQGGVDYPVVAIGDYAFWAEATPTGITSVTIPEGVRTIGSSAFDGGLRANGRVTQLSLPSTLRAISADAFRGNRISGLILPEGLETIGARSFLANQLTEVRIPESLSVVPRQAFARNEITVVQIPDTITELAEGAFARNQITHVDWPASLTTITGAFAENPLTSIDIPQTVTAIGDSAFNNTSFTSFEIPENVTSIGIYAFADSQLTEVVIPEWITVIPDQAFVNNPLVKVTIEGSGVTIGHSAFTTAVGAEETFAEVVFTAGPPASVNWGKVGGSGAINASTASFFNREPTQGDIASLPTISYRYEYSWQAGVEHGFSSPTWNGYPAVAVDAPEVLPAPVVPMAATKAPYVVTYSESEDQIQVQFAESDFAWDGGSAVTQYRITAYNADTGEAVESVLVDPGFTSADTVLTGLATGSYTVTVAAINAVGASEESPHSAASPVVSGSGIPGPVTIDMENDPFFETALHYERGTVDLYLTPDAEVGGQIRIVGTGWGVTNEAGEGEGVGVSMKLGGRGAYTFPSNGSDIWGQVKAGSNGVFDITLTLPDGGIEESGSVPAFRPGPTDIVFLVGSYWPLTLGGTYAPNEIPNSWFVDFLVGGEDGTRNPDGTVESDLNYRFAAVDADELVRPAPWGGLSPRVSVTVPSTMPFEVTPGQVIPAQETTLTLSLANAQDLRYYLDASKASINLDGLALKLGDSPAIPVEIDPVDLADLPESGTFVQTVRATLPEFTVPEDAEVGDWLLVSFPSTDLSLDLGYERDGQSRSATVAAQAAAAADVQYVYLPVVAGDAAPTVLTHPADRSVMAGEAVDFTATASGSPEPTVQWESSSDGGATWTSIVGATGGTLSFDPVSAEQDGTKYRALFANAEGSATSEPATLTVVTEAVAPEITEHPVDLAVSAGTTATFTATASGTPVPTVQWESSVDGQSWVPVAGATQPTLSLSSLTAEQSGTQYRAVFTNSGGSATSDAATLSVTGAVDENTLVTEVKDPSTGAVIGTLYTPKKIVAGERFTISGEGWFTTDGSLGSVSAVKLDQGGVSRTFEVIDPVTGQPASNMTIWDIAIADDATGDWEATLEFPTTENSNVAWGAGESHSLTILTGSLRAGDRIRSVTAPFEVVDELPGGGEDPTVPAQPAKPTATAEGTSVTVRWSAPADGGSAITGYGVTLTPQVGEPLTESVASDASSVVFNDVAEGSYTAAVIAANAVGTSQASPNSDPVVVGSGPVEPTAPVITTQPQATSAVVGQPAELSVVAEGEDLQYQWMRRAGSFLMPLVGQTQSTLSFDAVSAEDAGTYVVHVANAEGSVTSKAAKVTVVSPFTDVALSHAFIDEIGWLAASGISTGYDNGDGTKSFRPSDAVLREQMAAFLYRLAGSPEVEVPETSPFTDVPTDHAFYAAIVWLAQEDISTGYTEADGTTTFRPSQPVLREQMSAFLYRLAATQAGSDPAEVEPADFSDVPDEHVFAQEIAWLADSGITTGYDDGTFRPSQPVLREQMAAFLSRYVNDA